MIFVNIDRVCRSQFLMIRSMNEYGYCCSERVTQSSLIPTWQRHLFNNVVCRSHNYCFLQETRDFVEKVHAICVF